MVFLKNKKSIQYNLFSGGVGVGVGVYLDKLDRHDDCANDQEREPGLQEAAEAYKAPKEECFPP